MHLSSLCQYVQVLPVKLSPLVGLGVSATCGFDQSCADAPRSCYRCSFSGVGAENTLRHKCVLKGTQPGSLQTCHMSGQHSHMCSEKATKHSPHTSLGTTQDGRSLSVRPTGLWDVSSNILCNVLIIISFIYTYLSYFCPKLINVVHIIHIVCAFQFFLNTYIFAIVLYMLF